MLKRLAEEAIWTVPFGRLKWRLLTRYGLYPPRRAVLAEINKRYLESFKRLPDLDNPRTWSEKLQWLKLHDRNPLMPVAADKYRVRNFVASQGLGDILTDLIGVYDAEDEIDFKSLPEQFVLKVNHDSGGVIVVADRNKVDERQLRRRLNRLLRKPYAGGITMGEWHYLAIPRKIMVETYLGDMLGRAAEYRLHCCNGEVRFISVGGIVGGRRLSSLYDPDWKEIDVALQFPRFPQTMPRPALLGEMKEIAKVLCRNFTYVRVDLFQFDSRIHFGELTFFPGSGFSVLDPIEWDGIFGDWLQLP